MLFAFVIRSFPAQTMVFKISTYTLFYAEVWINLRLILIIYLFHKGYPGHQLLWILQLETLGQWLFLWYWCVTCQRTVEARLQAESFKHIMDVWYCLLMLVPYTSGAFMLYNNKNAPELNFFKWKHFVWEHWDAKNQILVYDKVKTTAWMWFNLWATPTLTKDPWSLQCLFTPIPIEFYLFITTFFKKDFIPLLGSNSLLKLLTSLCVPSCLLEWTCSSLSTPAIKPLF